MARPTAIDDKLMQWLRAGVAVAGATSLAKELNISETTLLRALAGLPLQAGTVALLRAAHERRKAA